MFAETQTDAREGGGGVLSFGSHGGGVRWVMRWRCAYSDKREMAARRSLRERPEEMERRGFAQSLKRVAVTEVCYETQVE